MTTTDRGGSPPQRVAPIGVAERWDPPGKPEGASVAAQDTYRQTQFQLSSDLRLLADGMNLQLQVVRDSYPSRYRTLPLATMVLYWSRVFMAISEAAHGLSRGAYAGCTTQVRAACEAIAAEVQAGGEEQPLFTGWLSEAMLPNEEHRATELGLGNYFAGSTLASNDRLGAVYRPAAEFSRQHFGVTMLEIAPESNREKIAVTFAEQSFHYAWAELILGWLLSLIAVQLGVGMDKQSPFFVSDDTRAAIARYLDRAAKSLTSPERCRVEEMVDGATRRFLVINFRRQSSGAPRKVLL